MAPDHQTVESKREPARLTVWGGGYIGLSTAIHFAKAGFLVHVYDVNHARVAAIAAGTPALPLFEEWIGHPLAPLVASGQITAGTDVREANRSTVHFVAVPTEHDGVPSQWEVFEVLGSLQASQPELVVIESTVTPGTSAIALDRWPTLPLVVAPRRDWFLGPERDLAHLPRVYAAATPEVADHALAVLRLVSPTLHRASSCAEAELSKCIENSLHHVAALHVTQIARAFPHVNVNEACALAASHWRVNTTYFASAGTGGYCLPVATAHLLRAAPTSIGMTIAQAAKAFESDQRRYVAELINEQSDGLIGVLGVTYRGDVPSATLSPSLDIARHLVELGRSVRVHDPYLSHDRMIQLDSFERFEFPTELPRLGAVFLGPAHRLYRSLGPDELTRWLRRGQLVMDNEGTWSDYRHAFESAGIRYRRLGGNYISPPTTEAPAMLNSRLVYSNAWLRVREDMIQQNDEVVPYAVVERPNSVVVLPITPDGHTILLRQKRHPVEAESLELPAGAIEPGESSDAAARREMLEECGIDATELQPIGAFRPVPALMAQSAAVFIARVTNEDVEKAFVSHGTDDILELRRSTISEVKRLIAGGVIFDGTTLGAVALAACRGNI